MIPPATISHEKGTFSSPDGLSLFCQSWLPAAPFQAHVLIVHGFGEHSDRYANVVQPLTAAGFAVHAYDTRGHGRTGGQRGHIDSWAQYRTDLLAFVAHITGRYGKAAVFLYGHSLGALMVLDFLLEHARMVQGAIISGAPFEPAGVAKPWLIAFARLAARFVPRLPAPVPISPTQLSSDPRVIAAIKADPMMRTTGSVRWGVEALATIERVKKEGARLQLPLLFIHGGADPINTAAGTSAFAAQLAAAPVTVQIYPGLLHEPHNEPAHPQVLAGVLDWLLAVRPQSGTE